MAWIQSPGRDSAHERGVGGRGTDGSVLQMPSRCRSEVLRVFCVLFAVVVSERQAVAQTIPTSESLSGEVRTEPPSLPAGEPEARPKGQAALSIGDAAPTWQTEQWINVPEGLAPVGAFEKGQIYVVEFWATWCIPCLKVFPHLSELQRKYKDQGVKIVGTNIWERSYDAQTLDKVTQFVEKQGESISYLVAFDGQGKAMDQAFMQAAEVRTIPAAFIIDREGRIAFIGHPRGMDRALEQVVKGTHDLKKLRAEYEREAAAERQQAELRRLGAQFNDAMRVKDYPAAWAAGRKLVDGPGAKNFMILSLVAGSMVEPARGVPVSEMDLDLAHRAMLQASDAVQAVYGSPNAEILWTLARVEFLRGNIDAAIDHQTKAIEKAHPSLKSKLEAALKEYQAAKR
jgi:thiol-disulfide isomerase/thioredoxin